LHPGLAFGHAIFKGLGTATKGLTADATLFITFFFVMVGTTLSVAGFDVAWIAGIALDVQFTFLNWWPRATVGILFIARILIAWVDVGLALVKTNGTAVFVYLVLALDVADLALIKVLGSPVLVLALNPNLTFIMVVSMPVSMVVMAHELELVVVIMSSVMIAFDPDLAFVEVSGPMVLVLNPDLTLLKVLRPAMVMLDDCLAFFDDPPWASAVTLNPHVPLLHSFRSTVPNIDIDLGVPSAMGTLWRSLAMGLVMCMVTIRIHRLQSRQEPNDLHQTPMRSIDLLLPVL
jgi:hypothetical protein